jgi:rhodanese-related sulfurtransferase
MSLKTILALFALLVFLTTASLIYLTPLKWVTVVEPVIHDVGPLEFYEDYSENPDDYIFIDVRQAQAYDTAHAKGSISQPIGSLFDGHRLLPRTDKKIVLICSSGRLAGVAYGYLEHQGFLNLLRIEGGVQAWALAGLPLEGNNLAAPIPTID